jgi:hypothetical protein
LLGQRCEVEVELAINEPNLEQMRGLPKKRFLIGGHSGELLPFERAHVEVAAVYVKAFAVLDKRKFVMTEWTERLVIFGRFLY